ncbi:MAG: hypothetical protein J6V21_00610 [Alistipes sp.]|nr:hypothetical protein [Alistipes sp.]
MKISGRNLALRLQLLGNRLSRIKHRKGHGVHSPFVYSLVRKVFMRKDLFDGTGSELYDVLRANGLSVKSARQLHNLIFHIEAKGYSINKVGGEVSILLPDYPTEGLREALEVAKRERLTLVVCQPYANRERHREVVALLDDHRSTSVDNRAYILFFNNHLPKQHYRL